jgi:hypothetical protein
MKTLVLITALFATTAAAATFKDVMRDVPVGPVCRNDPGFTGTDIAGRMYLSLYAGGSLIYSATASPTNEAGAPEPANASILRLHQSVMIGEPGTGRLPGPVEATSSSGQPIGPAGGVFVCPPGTTLTNGTTTLCTGTNVNPLP